MENFGNRSRLKDFGSQTTSIRHPKNQKGITKQDECTICHKALNPGLVKAWEESSHANLDKLQDYQKGKLAEIEKNIGEKLIKVGGIDCHGKIGSEKLNHEKELVMPSPAHCGECHKQEFQEFESEKQYGIPDWKPGRESHAKSYDANLDVDVWAAVGKNVVQGCEYVSYIQHKCDSCHTRYAFKASESRRPEACQTCHNGPDILILNITRIPSTAPYILLRGNIGIGANH